MHLICMCDICVPPSDPLISVCGACMCHECSIHPPLPHTHTLPPVRDRHMNEVEKLAATEVGVASRLSSPVVNTTINTKSMAFDRCVCACVYALCRV